MITVDVLYCAAVVMFVIITPLFFYLIRSARTNNFGDFATAGTMFVLLVLLALLVGAHAGSIYHACAVVDWNKATCKEFRK